MSFTFLSFHDRGEQNGLLLSAVGFINIYPIVPILSYKRNIERKILEITQSFRHCYNCGSRLKPNEIKGCVNCGYRFPSINEYILGGTKLKIGFFKIVAIVGIIFIGTTFIHSFTASGYRDLIDPIVIVGFNWLFMVGGIIFASTSIGVHKNRTQKIMEEIKQNLKYCNSCGTSLSTPIEKKCPHCSYRFPIDNLMVLII